LGKFGALRILIYRDLQIRYAGTWLGYLWTLLDPLAMAFIYWLVFTQIIGAKNIGEQPYILFLLTGILSWTWFNGSVTGTEFLLAFPILIIITLITQASVNLEIFWIVFAIILQFLLLSGIGLILAPLTVLARDTSNLLRILLRMMFYLTPIIYGVSDIPERFQILSYFNPMTGIISMYRAGFWAEPNLITAVIFSTIISLTIFVIGVTFFKRIEKTVLKEV
jgi:ABC-2 type transport system permease protein